MTTRLTKSVIGAALITAACGVWAAGSLAIDTLQGEKYGFSFNHATTELADQRSLRECGSACSVVLRFGAECAAYSADQAKGSNAYGWGTASSSSNAQARATIECNERGGTSCKVRAWGCDATKVSAPVPKLAEPAASAPATPVAPIAPKPPEPSVRQDTAKPVTPAQQPATAGFSMLGSWSFDYESSTGYSATGTVRVSDDLGNGEFRGVMTQSFINGGVAKRVRQDVSIRLLGRAGVVISGSNPVYLKGSGNYSPDKFTLSVVNQNSLRGANSDSGGAGGAVTLTRE